MERLQRETLEEEYLNRFILMRACKHNFAVVRQAELGKIALSANDRYRFPLDFIETDLAPECNSQDYADVSALLLQKIAALISDATRQAGSEPEVVYITGGSAKSPLIRQVIRDLFGADIAIVDGDHFGSVAAGLGVWAERMFS